MLASERLNFFSPPWVRREHAARFEFAAQYVKDRVVVDCACGNGEATGFFIKAGAKQILAFDVSRSAVRRAQKKFAATFHVGNGLRLPLPDQNVDVYVCLETIEHVKEDRLFLKETVRVLRKEGFFICSTPNRLVTHPGATLSDRPRNRHHVREYAPQEFCELLSSFFEDVRLHGQNDSSIELFRDDASYKYLLAVCTAPREESVR